MVPQESCVSCVKLFSIRNQITSALYQQNIKLTYNSTDNQVDITHVLQFIKISEKPISNSQVCLVDNILKRHVYLGIYPNTSLYIPINCLSSDKIVLTFKPIFKEEENQSSKRISKRKVKERTIQEAIKAVNEWINLSNIKNTQGKKAYTLQQAADILGYSKKTLNDYYKHIKLSQRFHFDLEGNMKQKMGVMKAFVRNKIAQGEIGQVRMEEQIDPDNFWSLQICRSSSSSS